MAFKTEILICTLLLGSLALPVPDEEEDMSIYFDSVGVVGGTVAHIEQHPWMVAYTSGGSARYLLCGGSIISQRTILTAAHCMRRKTEKTRVIVGTDRYDSGGVVYGINGTIPHPEYNGNFNDIGCIYTSENIAFNEKVRVVALSFANIEGGVQARLAGWGSDGERSVSEQLLEITVPTLGGPECVRAMREAADLRNITLRPINPDVHLCTLFGRGHGACFGDSGSALTRNDTREQIGIVSWGVPCAVGAPDVFARVSNYAKWIKEILRN